MNFIDTLLNTPNHPTDKSASADIGDLFLDTNTRALQHGRTGGKKSAAEGESLLEAFDKVVATGKKRADAVSDKALSDAEARNWVDRMLNEGHKPKDIAAAIEKHAAIEVFNHSIAAERLQDRAGILGLAYIEPAHYMKDCVATHTRLAKRGGTKAASVSQIKACTGCQYFNNKQGSAKKCNLYHLPIVASAAELAGVIKTIVPDAKNKKAALIQIANNVGVIATASKTSAVVTRTTAKGQALGQKKNSPIAKKAGSFNKIDVLNLHNEGKSIKEIFAQGARMVGSGPAGDAIKGFIAALRGTKTKIALSQIDCTLLKGKLGASNSIHGANKCGSCTYRSGMHCGLTGGTLVSFPGMAKQMSSHRIAANAPKDGVGMVQEFDLLSRPAMADIETPAEVVDDDFELNGFGALDV